MNDEGMKQEQRFMAPWRIEYVWLSAVGWEQLSLNERHMERNLLNDSISSEKSQEEGFSLILPHSSPSQIFVGMHLKMRGDDPTEILQCCRTKMKECMSCGTDQLWCIKWEGFLVMRCKSCRSKKLTSPGFMKAKSWPYWDKTAALSLYSRTLISLWKGVTVTVRVKSHSLSSVIQ